MASKGERQNVRGVVCTMIALDTWGWVLMSRQTWTFELWGKRLRCMGETVAEGVKNLKDAVQFSHGYETAVMDMARRAKMSDQAKRDREGRIMSIPLNRPEQEGEK